MKKIIILLSLFTLVIVACNQLKQPEYPIASKYITTSNLEIQTFVINTKKDTSVITHEGIKVSVAANSIEAATETVTLEIKESLSLYDMLKAGLTTQSPDGLLSSDGMFYIGTKEKSDIKKPLQVSVPTQIADDKMKLYKGEEKDGKIEWKDPKPINQIDSSATSNGKILFTQCMSCHSVDKQLTASPLAWIDKRWKDHKSLSSFIRNPYGFLKEASKSDSTFNKLWSYLACTFCKRGQTVMTSFPHLSDKEIDDIVRYIDKEAKKLNIPETFNPNSDCDSCEYYALYYHDLKYKRDSLISRNSKMTELKMNIPVTTGNFNNLIVDTNDDVPTTVVPPTYNSEYYKIEITTYGWYNIDILLKEKTNTVESELMVRIQGEYIKRTNVYLVIPSIKLFAEGGFLEDSAAFGFYEKNGKIPLPQNTEAFIVGVSEKDGKLYYGQTSFTTSLKQIIQLNYKETTEKEIIASMRFLRKDSVSIKVEKVENFEGIKAVDKELKRLTDKLKNCRCGESATAGDYISEPIK